jgi:hypothetical protein
MKTFGSPNRPTKCDHFLHYKRIKVKGHYRLVLRNPDGTFDKVKKWSSRKKKRR